MAVTLTGIALVISSLRNIEMRQRAHRHKGTVASTYKVPVLHLQHLAIKSNSCILLLTMPKSLNSASIFASDKALSPLLILP